MKLYDFLTDFYTKHGPAFKFAGIGGLSSGLLLFSDPSFGEHYIIAFIIRMAGVFFGTLLGGFAGLLVEKIKSKFFKPNKNENGSTNQKDSSAGGKAA